LVQGAQTINNTVINLKKVEEFDKPLIDFRLGGFSSISENLSFMCNICMEKVWFGWLSLKD
jgi:hypothetical protein